MFYTMQGDTMFDVMYEAHQVSPVFMIFYILVWLNLAIYIINKIALAMVEDGYLTQRHTKEQDWLTKNITDPGLQSNFDKIK